MGAAHSVLGVGSARAAREALAADPAFDLVLLDLKLGDADGFDLLIEFRAAFPALPVVVVSASDRSADIVRAIDLGAMGFVPKRVSHDALFDALRTVMSGGIYVPPLTMQSECGADAMGGAAATRASGTDGAGSAYRRTGHTGRTGPTPMLHESGQTPLGGAASITNAPPAGPAPGKLTPRQTEVLALLLRGQSNKLIARELDVSVETVKDHVAAVLRAFNVNTRTQAVLAVGRMAGQGAGPWLPGSTR